MAQFVLHVPDIEASGKTYRFAVPATWVQSVLDGSDLRADLAFEEGSLAIRADRSGDEILVTGTLRSRVLADCVRCLEDAGVDVDVKLAWLFTPLPAGARPKQEDEIVVSPEEPDREYYAGETIELDSMVREHLILEVPMQPLCAEDCEGIEIPEHVRPPADFGKVEGAEDVDPRLAPLKSLAEKFKQQPRQEPGGESSKAAARSEGGVAVTGPRTSHHEDKE